MKEKNPDIIEQYFKSQENCNSIDCKKVIFEPEKKREWFYEDDAWCYFDFLCEDMDYRLIMTEQKTSVDPTHLYLSNVPINLRLLGV